MDEKEMNEEYKIGHKYLIKKKNRETLRGILEKIEDFNGMLWFTINGQFIPFTDISNIEEVKPEPEIFRYRTKKPIKKPEKEFCNHCGKELDKNDPEYKYNPYGSSGLFCCREHWVETVDPNREFFKKKKAKKKC